MKLIYNACDLMVVSSTEDNLPNTAIEAKVFGKPVVSFQIRGFMILFHIKVMVTLLNPLTAKAWLMA